MTAGTGNGLGTAVELLGGFGDLGLGNEGEQTSFLDADDAPMPMPEAKGTSGPKGGRPKGARNRSTEEWRSFILSKYRSPLVFLAEMWSRTPAQLAAELGLYKFHEGKLVTAPIIDAEGRVMRDEEGHELRQPVLATGDAAAMQQAAAIAALPYLHQKQPMALEVKQTTRGVVILGSLEVAGAEGGDDLALPLAQAPERAQQNQQVIDVEPEKSHAPQSHDAPNPLEYRDE
ncbi:conserved protein of unknown function [Hyphomicrobium sp. 1Nfss2.1]|uniref:hypothetical protein n=1 Tax=Hyphomicrobium sp. 1Nfss2.1 TaxID=3413936 RepID=UPI003C7C65AB